jgi:formylglycine-generating enzyme required for sulfatase activity
MLLLAYAPVYAQNPAAKMPSMINVEGGTFMMGNNAGGANEKPVHNVTLNSFYLGKFEVTFSEFKKFVEVTGYKTDAEQPDTVRLKHGLPPAASTTGPGKCMQTGSPCLLQIPSTPSGTSAGTTPLNIANG